MALRDLTLEITRKCPMNCKLCSSNGGEPCDPEFSLDELKGIVDQAKDLGVTEISLSGGEPFTCPFLEELCRYTSDLGINAFIFTSGNWFDKNGLISSIPLDKFIDLKKSGIKKVVFSLHGSNADIHDLITRKPGSFNNLLQSIENAQKADLELEVHVVPVKENYRDIPAIVMLMDSIGVKSLHFLRFVSQGRGEVYKRELELTDLELFTLRHTLQELMKNSPIDITLGAHFSSLQLSSGRCTAGTAKAAIRPDGYVFPCVGMKNAKRFSNNNVRDKDLNYILNNSDIFASSRNMLKNSKSFVCLAQYLANPQSKKKWPLNTAPSSKIDSYMTKLCHTCENEV